MDVRRSRQVALDSRPASAAHSAASPTVPGIGPDGHTRRTRGRTARATRQVSANCLPVIVAWFGIVNAAAGGQPAHPSEASKAYGRHGLDPASPLESRVKDAPDSVLAQFGSPGRPAPTVHPLSDAERVKLKAAIDSLPPLHRRVLPRRLRAIHFLDGMPVAAQISTVDPDGPFRLFDVTINAAVLRLNVSEWLTQKERTCFDAAGSPLSVNIDMGAFDALVYVFLHEATHIVDLCEHVTPGDLPADQPPGAGGGPRSSFIEGVWSSRATPAPRYRDPLRGRVLFYTKDETIPVDQAEAVYTSLGTTPFASLYGGNNWLDDLAECVTIYHLTEVRKQPYRIVIREQGREVFVYEPMKSGLVRGRLGEMRRFYER